MQNPFENRAPVLSGPSKDIAPITPSDSVDLEKFALAIYVETGGTLSFISIAGEERSVVVGDLSILPVGVQRINATGTTASGIHAFIIG